MGMKRIFLLRHGEFPYLSNDGCLANYSDKGLSENGIGQVESIAMLFRDVQVDAIYASPLERTIHSANIIARESNLEIEIVPEFKELDIGSGDGKTIEELLRICPDFMKDPAAKLPKGENLYDLSRRCLKAYYEIVANPGQYVIIVSHATVNRVIICDVLGLDLSNFGHVEQDAACINIIDYFGEVAVVKLLNFTNYDAVKKNLVEYTLDLRLELQRSQM